MNPKILNSIQKIPSKFIGSQFDVSIDAVSIDSRSLQNGSQTLFFALVGIHSDAHHYIPELIENDVLNFVVNHIPEGFETKANFYVVENTLAALQEFAARYRSLFNFPIIGLT